MTKSIVIYHANCTDGFTAAWVAARALGEVELFPGFYGTDPPDVTGRDVYVLDFSYKLPVMLALCAQARTLTVLDHHKTAESDLLNLSTGEGVSCVFDMERSGARLAWDYFVAPSLEHWASSEMAIAPRAEWLVNYVQDRDLWRWALPNSRLVSAGIEAVEKTLPAWDALATRTPESLAADGEVIERYRQRCIAAAAELARPLRIADHVVPAANSSEMRFASDTAHVLADGHPFAATYWVRADGIVQFSLRSREDGVDVSEIAKRYGGGGHRHAAGFQLPLADLKAMEAAA